MASNQPRKDPSDMVSLKEGKLIAYVHPTHPKFILYYVLYSLRVKLFIRTVNIHAVTKLRFVR